MNAADPQRCTVLALSMIPESLAGYPEAEELVTRSARVTEAARAVGVPVIHGIVQFREGYPEIGAESRFSAFREAGRGKEGSRSVAPVESLGPGILLAKRRAGAFAGTDLELILRAQRRDTLVLLGVRTSGAILHTACWALDLDYRLLIVTDCCADPDERLHATLVERLFPSLGASTSRQLCATWVAPSA